EKNKIVQINGKLLLTVKGELEQLNYGDRLRFSARIRNPRNFNNPGGFDYKTYLALKEILVTASIKDGREIARVEETTLNPILKTVEKYRTQIREFLSINLHSPAAEIAKALILGEKGEIPKELRERFSAAGVAHILAISGLHCGIIALVCFFLIKNILKCSTRLMLSTDISKVSAFVTLIPVITYCFIAGHGVATIRATIMVITYLTAIIIGREEDLWNTLAVAAFLILVFSPSSLFDISFQLSFISVVSILYLTPRFSTPLFQHSKDPLEPPPPWWKKIARRITLFLIVTISAIIGTAPLAAFYFNRFSPWGFLTNLVIIPLVGFLVVPLGLLASFSLFLFQPLAIFIAYIMQPLITLSTSIVELFNHLPYADYRTTTPTLLEIALFYLGIVFLINIKKSKKARYGLALVLIVFFSNQGFWYYQNKLSPLLRITSIDVGQGESTLVQFPKGATMLIDGGGFYDNSFDIGEKVVAPLIWKKKIKHIDYLVLSHPQSDHLNGLVSIVKNFKIKEVWTNGEKANTEIFKEFEKTIAEKGIKHLIINREHPDRNINGVLIEYLHPPKPPYTINYHSRVNNHSLVIRLTYKDINMLFTGDIYQEAERELINTTPNLASTILKVPHHGSSTSSSPAFLKQVQPEFAIMNLGFKNIFHLPSRKVLKRYQDQGCQIFRTDQDGAITIETDGSEIRIKTFLKHEEI
ncbi:MAG: DNA internalization-related competence protein ComEC/Rec2, partial [Deltaproteobacteria bacterium]|nr:DNA internalization-related competence protein ComEC/Rec2 [Deltaproteobacteria bacterium]